MQVGRGSVEARGVAGVVRVLPILSFLRQKWSGCWLGCLLQQCMVSQHLLLVWHRPSSSLCCDCSLCLIFTLFSYLPEAGGSSSWRASGGTLGSVCTWDFSKLGRFSKISGVSENDSDVRHDRDVEGAVREVVAGSERRGEWLWSLAAKLYSERLLKDWRWVCFGIRRSVSTVVLNFCLERIPVLGCPTAMSSVMELTDLYWEDLQLPRNTGLASDNVGRKTQPFAFFGNWCLA